MIEPINFLDIARQLLEDPDYITESSLRTSIGRAYYAAFHNIKMKLEVNGGHRFNKVHRLHMDVITEVNAISSVIGNKLNDLFDHRVEADYKLLDNIDAEKARYCVKIAEIIINSSDDLAKKMGT